MDRKERAIYLRMAKEEAQKCEVVGRGKDSKYFPTRNFEDLQLIVMHSDDLELITAFAKLKGADVKALGRAVLASDKDSFGIHNAQFAKIEGADVDAHVKYVLDKGDVIAISSMAETQDLVEGMDYSAMLERVEELGAINIADALGESAEYSNMYFSAAVLAIKEKIEMQNESQS